MKGFVALLAAGFVLAAGAASPTLGEPLEPEKAFRLTARATADGQAIDLAYTIEPGYYLYADRFKVDASGLPAGALEVPPGIQKDDPFVGPTRILKRSAKLRLPLVASVKPGTYRLKVTAQGCAEERLCYMPFTQAVAVRLPR